MSKKRIKKLKAKNAVPLSFVIKLSTLSDKGPYLQEYPHIFKFLLRERVSVVWSALIKIQLLQALPKEVSLGIYRILTIKR